MPFTEFYCNASTGSNINAGDLTANGVVTSTNGDWGNAAANRFTAAAGTPFSGVSVGDFASVYLDGATVAVYIARVTAVNGGGASIDLSTTAKSGTAPANGATGRSCTTGGAWLGPNGSVAFPFGFITSAQTNSAGDAPRVNFKSGTNYAVTAAMTHSNTFCNFRGYTTTAGDGGRATIDGGNSGASYGLLTLTSGWLEDLTFNRNGATGSATGVSVTGTGTVQRCVFSNMRGNGLSVGTSQNYRVKECEAFGNGAGSAVTAGFIGSSASTIFIRCISHDNSGYGFRILSGQPLTFLNCIADSNASDGFKGGSSAALFSGCDAYNNGGDGFDFDGSNAGLCIFENCNAIKNTGWGLNYANTGATMAGGIYNMGYGAGTMANGSGTRTGTLQSTMEETGTVTYTSNATPWVDPANGDFRISLAAAQGTGRGAYLQTASGYAGTVSYPDIGAAQHADAGSGGGTRAYGSVS